VANSAAVREPQRPLLFALALLIHVGLYFLLLSPRHTSPEAPERRTVLVFLQDTAGSRRPPRAVAPIAPPHLTEPLPPASTAPQLSVPPEHAPTGVPPAIDWHGDGEQVAREHALEEAGRERKHDEGPPKPKSAFGWSHSRVQRIEPMASGGFIVWISDNCFVVVGVMAMPMCKLGKNPARGDLFEHMDDPGTAGDWKDD